MSETLGTLVSKLAVVLLKLWHTQELNKKKETEQLLEKQKSLLIQREQIIGEIDNFEERLRREPDGVVVCFPSNKLYGQD